MAHLELEQHMYIGYRTVDDHDKCILLFRDAYVLNSGAASTEPEGDLIKQLLLVQELELLGQRHGDWAEEMVMYMPL